MLRVNKISREVMTVVYVVSKLKTFIRGHILERIYYSFPDNNLHNENIERMEAIA